MADRDNEITTLNTLIATLIDSVTGYEDAAANIEVGRFQQLFRERAGERQRVVEELRAEVRRLGGNPEDDGSFLGKTHQRFLDLKAAITGRDEKAIINEVERGEDYLKEKFQTALDSGYLSGESRSAVVSMVPAVFHSMRLVSVGFKAGSRGGPARGAGGGMGRRFQRSSARAARAPSTERGPANRIASTTAATTTPTFNNRPAAIQVLMTALRPKFTVLTSRWSSHGGVTNGHGGFYTSQLAIEHSMPEWRNW